MAVYEVVLLGKQGINDMLNVFHYEVADGVTPDWQAGADEIRSHLAVRLVPNCGSDVKWSGIKTRLDSPGQVAVEFPFTSGVLAGDNATPSQIRQVAMLVQKLSTGGIRPVLGWFFQGGIVVEAADAGGKWETTQLNAVQAYAEDIMILGAVAPLGAAMVIKARNPTAPNTQPYSVVDVVVAKDTPRTVRSRATGRGS